MLTMTVPHRPFSSDRITSIMLPDGIFESSLGKQRLNAYFQNNGTAALTDLNIYIESVSDPRIMIAPQTHHVPQLTPNASRVLSWDADFSNCPPGEYYISFIQQNSLDFKRSIKKIFVTQVQFDPVSGTFSAETPQGKMSVNFKKWIGPKGGGCCCGRDHDHSKDRETGANHSNNILADILGSFKEADPNFKFCVQSYLPEAVSMHVTPIPSAFSGQYSDLPYEDPWWKVLFCILAAILLIAAAIAEATDGSGEVIVSGGTPDPDTGAGACCGISASGGGTSYVAAGLVAAAAAAATIAAMSDVRDPFRRGQDNTLPAPGELTIGEGLDIRFDYIEPIVLGKPFSVGTDWTYTRYTTGGTYNYSVSETNQNTHVLSKYEVNAPDVVLTYKERIWTVMAQFFDENGKKLTGPQLFVQCLMVGPAGQQRRLILQDDGIQPDEKANDGLYTGRTLFSMRDRGLWTYYVIAQDVNHAKPDMAPEEAAQIIGGMILTNQLTIDFSGGTCPFVPDGHVNVI